MMQKNNHIQLSIIFLSFVLFDILIICAMLMKGKANFSALLTNLIK